LQLAAGAQNKLIQAIATAVHTESLTSPGEILARYARRPEQSLIKKAFEYKPLLPQEHLRDEFIGRMQRKFARFQEVEARSQINHLLLKPPSALTDEERLLLRQHLSKRS
jgi:hypothetical protein